MTSRISSVAVSLLIAIACTVGVVASAQFGGKPRTDNPTPGTPQPDPPNLADRITLVGCVQLTTQNAAGGAAHVDQSAPSDSRYVLINAQRRKVVPVGTGGSKLAASRRSKTYRLAGIDSQLSPFVGGKAEISGELRPQPTGEREGPPTVQVEFVQRLASSCP